MTFLILYLMVAGFVAIPLILAERNADFGYYLTIALLCLFWPVTVIAAVIYSAWKRIQEPHDL